jgi:ATP-dependent exoDNAse (exonuclease V) beta subunit
LAKRAGKLGARRIVDRLVVEDARVIVLDFKTDRPAPTDPREGA